MLVQLKLFDPKKMGTKINYCLRNVRLGYGIDPKWSDAKEAMNENRVKGTLYDLNTIPNNVSVPVFTDKYPSAKYGHVKVCHNGVFYDNGKVCKKPSNNYKWGLWLNGVKVAEEKKDVIKIGDTVRVVGQGTSKSNRTCLIIPLITTISIIFNIDNSHHTVIKEFSF